MRQFPRMSAPLEGNPPAAAGTEGELAALERVRCGLCDGDHSRVLFRSTPAIEDPDDFADFVASTDSFDRYGTIVRCLRCGLVYTNPRPTADRIGRGYERAVDRVYAEEDASRSINAHMSLYTIRKLISTGRLLDIGCSTGYFLNAARLDFDTFGIEPSAWAVEYARRRLGLNVRRGTVEGLGPENGLFDVVAMNDVIEHVTDPAGALARIARVTRPGGVLYLVTPDIGSLSASILRGRWWGLRPAHLYYFSRETLTAILARAGFDVVLMRSYGRIFTYGYWLTRLRSYPAWVSRIAAAAVRILGIEDKFLYLNTRDSLEVCARRR